MSDDPTAGDMVDGLLASRVVQTAAALIVFAVSAWFAVNGGNMEGARRGRSDGRYVENGDRVRGTSLIGPSGTFRKLWTHL